MGVPVPAVMWKLAGLMTRRTIEVSATAGVLLSSFTSNMVVRGSNPLLCHVISTLEPIPAVIALSNGRRPK